MRTLFSTLAFLSLTALHAQDPVRWTFTVDQSAEYPIVVMQATMDEGWHIYGLELESDEGPLPTVLQFGNEVEWGELNVPEPKRKYDEMFMMNITYYDSQVTFTRPVSMHSSSVVRGSVDYMVCNDETCLPPKLVPFELSLKPVDN
jgi:DsbC/DsbD-like thiol-disulfide interchange protein